MPHDHDETDPHTLATLLLIEHGIDIALDELQEDEDRTGLLTIDEEPAIPSGFIRRGSP